MTTLTPIEWCDYSSNPIKYHNRETGNVVWACVKKSDGCTNCYSEALARRWNKGLPFARPNIDKVEPFLDEKELRQLATDPKLSGTRVFIGDMTDIFGSWVPDAMLAHLFGVFASRKDVTFLCLTKRPERAATLLGSVRFPYDVRSTGHLDWPLANVWLGTSVENQEAADERIPHLLKVPAAVRFLSCEPLLGPVDLFRYSEWEGALRGVGVVLSGGRTPDTPDYPSEGYDDSYPGIDWVIIGGESGPKYRPMEITWLNDLANQCLNADVPVYVKQDSGLYPGRQGRIPECRWLHQFPAPAAVAPGDRP